jgi:hypothetical protein
LQKCLKARNATFALGIIKNNDLNGQVILKESNDVNEKGIFDYYNVKQIIQSRFRPEIKSEFQDGGIYLLQWSVQKK